MMVAFWLLAFLAYFPQSAATIQARGQTDAVPPALAAPIASALGSGGVHVDTGKGTLDFWWVKAVALKADSSGPPAWSAVEEGTLVGAVRVATDFPDIRGRIVKAGVYTLRYGLQPSNGDHLGVSPFREFLLIGPAGLDTDVAPRGHDGTIEISKRTIGGSHPAAWSIDPPSATAKEPVLGTHTTDLGHQSVIVEVPATRGGSPAGTLRFGVVLAGRIEA